MSNSIPQVHIGALSQADTPQAIAVLALGALSSGESPCQLASSELKDIFAINQIGLTESLDSILSHATDKIVENPIQSAKWALECLRNSGAHNDAFLMIWYMLYLRGPISIEKIEAIEGLRHALGVTLEFAEMVFHHFIAEGGALEKDAFIN